ncbi:MAG: AmmeMemoRadiSam system protein B [bacterium]
MRRAMRIWPILLLAAVTACEGRQARPKTVRPPAKAGTWYTGDARALRREIEGYFEKAPDVKLGGTPRAVIAPHAGYRFSGKCAGAAYALVRDKDIRRVIALGPSHHLGFRGASVPAVDAYRTPLGVIPLDREARDDILKSELVRNIPAAHKDEHSVELQLPFLQLALEDFELVPVVIGRLTDDDYAGLAARLRRHVDEHTLIVASSDFTHYGRMFRFTPFKEDIRKNIEKLDKGAIKHILAVEPDAFRKYVRKTGATICGRAPIAVMLHMLPPDADGKLVRYYMSGDLENRYTHSVSYAAIAFTGGQAVSRAGQRRLLEIARATLRARLAGREPPDPEIRSPELLARRGAFVTYKNGGRLRGCIGRFIAKQAVWKVVRQMAVAAARDPRFARDPITLREEPKLDVEISVLSPLERIKDPLDFEVGVHGLYIVRGRRRGTYLPQVATEQGWGKKAFISHLCRQKVGIAADAWKQPKTQIFRYSAQVFGE